MIFFIYGADNFRCRQKLNELKAGFVQKRDKSGFNIVILNGEKLDFDHFKQEVLATPFLSEKKMIIVKNVLANKKFQKPAAEFLKQEAAKIDNVVGFVEQLSGPKDLPTGPLFQFLSKEKFCWRFNPFNQRELALWLKKYIAQKNIKIEPAAEASLIALVGNDLNAVTLELDKLIAYAKEKTIASYDVRALVKAKFDDNIFNFIDALSQKDKKAALRLLADQLQSGTHELLVLKMMSRQFKILLKIKGGAKSNELGLHPFVLKKALWQVKNFTLENLLAIYRDLVNIESQMKSGKKNLELLFDLFIAKNC